MDSGAVLDLIKNLAIIFVVVFYVATVLWTYKDSRRRIEDPVLVATSVATAMIPFVGVLVYMLLRPPEYIADVRERELEIRAMERTLGRQERCPYCKSHIEGDFLSCPICATKLRQSCRRCDKPLDPRWKMCPYCETDAPRAQSVDVGARERGSTSGARGSRPSGPGSRASGPGPSADPDAKAASRSAARRATAGTGSTTRSKPRSEASARRTGSTARTPATVDEPSPTKPRNATKASTRKGTTTRARATTATVETEVVAPDTPRTTDSVRSSRADDES